MPWPTRGRCSPRSRSSSLRSSRASPPTSMARTDRPPGRSGVPWKPTRDQLAAAYGKAVPDVIARNLGVLFVGINPGLYSGAVGHHFARPGNRFWKSLHRAGFTEEVLSPFHERRLLERGIGITNLVTRSTANADEITVEELREGLRRVRR